MKVEDWHFPRADLARRYLKALDVGLAPSLTLFAPRRKGKTEFLLRDLTPEAEKSGYRVGYCNFWQARELPLPTLLACLGQLAQPRSLGQRLARALKTPVDTAALELELAGASLTASTTFESGNKPAEGLLGIEPAFRRAIAAAKSRRILLLLDEVQYLARAQHENFVASLRTSLDMHRDRVQVVFTGSSRTRLLAMFRHVKAPLFNFSQPTDFPDLDRPFVEFMCDRFRRATTREVDVEQAWRAFELTQRTPGVLHEAFAVLALQTHGTDIAKVTRFVMAKMTDEADHAERYAALRDLDRAALEVVVRGRAPFSETTLEGLAEQLGTDVSASQMQRSLERLVDLQLVYQADRGQYEIEDPGFRHWLDRHIGIGSHDRPPSR